MPDGVASLLLSGRLAAALDWPLILLFFWVPQLLWASFALGVLLLATQGLRRHRLRGVLMGLPYLLLGLAVVLAGSYAQSARGTPDDSLRGVLTGSFIWVYFAPTLLASLGLVGLHGWLLLREAGPAARET